MNMRHRISLFSFLVVFLWSGFAFGGDWTETDVFVGVDEAQELISGGATVVDARESEDFQRGHIAGAANLTWQDFVNGEGSGEVVDDDRQLTSLLQRAGVSEDSPVVVYGNWSQEGSWGEEGRIFWTLEYLGHDDVYILEGGLPAWQSSGNAIASGASAMAQKGDFEVNRQAERRISTESLKSAVSVGNRVEIVDTREAEEYGGEVKYGEARGGHIPGAEHIWWRDLFDEDGELRPWQAIGQKLDKRGIEESDDIVVYCTGGVRSGFVYAVLRAKGFENVRNYDASMWDWTSNGAPVQTP